MMVSHELLHYIELSLISFINDSVYYYLTSLIFFNFIY